MVRSKSDVWNYFKIEGNKAICNFCQKEAFKNPSRMPVHLIKCSKCPESVKTKVSGMISKSCVSLCKNTPVFKILESKLKTSHYINSSVEEHNFEGLDDIELLSEEDVEKNEIYSSDDKFKFVVTEKSNETLNGRMKLSDSCSEVILDEFSKFGDCVAHKLRNINNPRARAIAQYYINTVLFRAEMTNFEEELPFASPQEFKLFDKVQKSISDDLEFN